MVDARFSEPEEERQYFLNGIAQFNLFYGILKKIFSLQLININFNLLSVLYNPIVAYKNMHFTVM